MKFDIIVNPAGAGGKTKLVFESLKPLFLGTDYEVHWSSLEFGIGDIVRKLTSAGKEANLIIVGGDGSMNEAVNAIQNFTHTRIGLIPCGSANDLAADIGIGSSLEDHVRKMLQGNTVRSIDVGEVIMHSVTEPLKVPEGEEPHVRFNVSAGIGWDAEICQCVEVSPWKKPLNKAHLGKLVYIAEAIRTVFGMKPFVSEITADGRTFSYDKTVFLSFMNHRFEGGGFMFGPHASNRDGILDLCAVNDVTPLKFFLMFPRTYKGKQFETSLAFETRAPGYEIRTSEPVYVHTDGEVQCRSDHVTVRLLNEKLNLLF